MSTGMFATPRPIPGRLVPALAGSALIVLALPVFAVAGWPLDGWVLAATLWVAGQAFAFFPHLQRLFLHLRENCGDLFLVEVCSDPGIAGALDHGVERALYLGLKWASIW